MVGEKQIKNKRNAFYKKGVIFCYIMLSLSIIHFIIFWLCVNISSIKIAFTVRDGTGIEKFSLANFELFFVDVANPNGTIFSAIKNTVLYFLMDMFKRVLAFVIAYFFYKKIWGSKTFRVIFYLPSLLSDLIIVTIFKKFIATGGPLYNVLLELFNYELPVLLGSPETATGTILFYVLWSGFGATMLIFVGVMNRIPEDIIEAARIDGCTWFKEFTKIVIPLAWETLYTMLVLGMAGIVMASGPIMVFTGGAFDTYTLSYWIFAQTKAGSYNYPAAIGLLTTVITIPITFISRWLMSKFNSDITY